MIQLEWYSFLMGITVTSIAFALYFQNELRKDLKEIAKNSKQLKRKQKAKNNELLYWKRKGQAVAKILQQVHLYKVQLQK